MDHEALRATDLGVFNLSRSPQDLAQWVVATPLHLRSGVKVTPGGVVESISDKDVLVTLAIMIYSIVIAIFPMLLGYLRPSVIKEKVTLESMPNTMICWHSPSK